MHAHAHAQELVGLLVSSGAVTLPLLRANEGRAFTLFAPNLTALAAAAQAAQNATPGGLSAWLRSPAGRATLLTHVFLGDTLPYEWADQEQITMASGVNVTVSKYDGAIELWTPAQRSHARLKGVEALRLGNVTVHLLDGVLLP
jgi:hypothetical protein